MYPYKLYSFRVLKVMISSLRPKQWVKNLLIYAAPAAAGTLGSEFISVTIGFFGFVFASSFGYVINDWRDREYDRNHDKKKSRAFASGKLGKAHMLTMLLLLGVCFILCSFFLSWGYAVCLGVYIFITLTYSTWLKNVAVVEMLWVASGFLIRALAGSVISGLSPTGWFLLSIFFGSVFVVGTKRLSEKMNYLDADIRKVMAQYSDKFLQTVIQISLTITLLTYSLWVFQVHPESIIGQFSILPLCLATFRYLWHADHGRAEKPEDLIWRDPLLSLSSLLIIVCLVLMFGDKL
jgi:decaprenyl-phosphate phosphoribosyltransferase